MSRLFKVEERFYYLNPEHVSAIEPQEHGASRVFLLGGQVFFVQASPEQLYEIMRVQLTKPPSVEPAVPERSP